MHYGKSELFRAWRITFVLESVAGPRKEVNERERSGDIITARVLEKTCGPEPTFELVVEGEGAEYYGRALYFSKMYNRWIFTTPTKKGLREYEVLFFAKIRSIERAR